MKLWIHLKDQQNTQDKTQVWFQRHNCSILSALTQKHMTTDLIFNSLLYIILIIIQTLLALFLVTLAFNYLSFGGSFFLRLMWYLWISEDKKTNFNKKLQKDLWLPDIFFQLSHTAS